jgi:hypothetical protein
LICQPCVVSAKRQPSDPDEILTGIGRHSAGSMAGLSPNPCAARATSLNTFDRASRSMRAERKPDSGSGEIDM